MINTIHLQDFKAHRSTLVRLGRLTMLVGDNASGKSSVLEALRLQAALSPNPVTVLRDNWSPADLLRRGGRGPIVFTSNGEQKLEWSLTIKLDVESQGEPMERRWGLSVVAKFPEKAENPVEATAQGAGGGGGAGGDWSILPAMLRTVRLYGFRAARIAAAAYSAEPSVFVHPDGTNTAVVLAALKLDDDDAFVRIEEATRKLIPSLERIRLRREAVRDGLGYKIYFDFHGAPAVPAHHASHGTLIVLALLTVLYGPDRPDLILLDDFDHALHPRAQMELVRMIKGLLALDDFKEVQVVATTHSPYTLDELDPDDVQVFALRDDGTVATKRLSEHPDAARTKGALLAGQLWSLDPERDWVLRDETP